MTAQTAAAAPAPQHTSTPSAPVLSANGLTDQERGGVAKFLTEHRHCLEEIEKAFKEVAAVQTEKEKAETGISPRTMLQNEGFYDAAVQMHFDNFVALVQSFADLRDGKQITQDQFHVLMKAESGFDALKEWVKLLQDISEKHLSGPAFDASHHIPPHLAMFDKTRLEAITTAVNAVLNPIKSGLKQTETSERLLAHLLPLTPEQQKAIADAAPIAGVTTKDPDKTHLHGLPLLSTDTTKLPTQVARLEQQKAQAAAMAAGAGAGIKP